VDLYLVSPQHPLLPRLIQRVPFYNIIKSLVLVYLALPQSEVRHIIWTRVRADKQGASYIYRAHLAPFFQEHERDIDVFLASLRTRAGSAFAGGLTWLWTWIRTQLNVRQPIRLFAARSPVNQGKADSADCSSSRTTSRGTGSWSLSWSAVSIRTYADGPASYATRSRFRTRETIWHGSEICGRVSHSNLM
jgi:hypothetical protein